MTTELDAARMVRAALRAIRDTVPQESRDLVKLLDGWQDEIGYAVSSMERTDTEPAAPGVRLTWSEVIPGDSVLAPNGTWYEVDSTARIGIMVRALLKIEGRTVGTDRLAAGQVTVRRGPAGRAADVFRAGGINVEVMAG